VTVVSPPPVYPMARQGHGHAPLRRPGSVRRTTSIDTHWPDGWGKDAEMTGRARDIMTPLDGGAPQTFATAGFTMTITPRREIVAIATEPRHPRDQDMVGVRAGGASREALSHIMGDIRGTPLFQIIDDFAGASLVGGWIWSHWEPEWMARARAEMQQSGDFKGPRANICSGFAEGSSALDFDNRPTVGAQRRVEVPPLENPEDPAGWHAMAVTHGPVMRRARRIDLWRDGASIRIDAGFQDSGNAPEDDGTRVAIHEYRVHVLIDAATMTITALQALPLILPFPECPAASINASRMIGEQAGDLRQRVIDALPGIDGCTHLNDVLRSIADVPALAEHLPD
jgi:hypothetical protein